MSLHAPAGSLETVEAYGDGPFNTPQNEWADTDDDEGAASPNTISVSLRSVSACRLS
jgi:hypothetical protein